MKVNSPSVKGYELGGNLARFADAEMKKRKAVNPAHVERCATCAFRKGTLPNGCEQTLLDALGCLFSHGRTIFECHERRNHECIGFAILKT